ncbi:MAG: Hsp20/alpha crystallin family protein [Mesorhizobium sp.]
MSVRSYLPSLWDRNDKQPAGFGSLRKEIDRLFEDFSKGFDLPALATGGGFGLVPDMDMHDGEKDVTLSIELPGVDEKDIDLSVSGQMITISGEKKSEKETKEGESVRRERSYGSFSRTVTLPFRIDGDKVKAKFAKGVLTVTVPKPEDAMRQAKKVPIAAG